MIASVKWPSAKVAEYDEKGGKRCGGIVVEVVKLTLEFGAAVLHQCFENLYENPISEWAPVVNR